MLSIITCFLIAWRCEVLRGCCGEAGEEVGGSERVASPVLCSSILSMKRVEEGGRVGMRRLEGWKLEAGSFVCEMKIEIRSSCLV